MKALRGGESVVRWWWWWVGGASPFKQGEILGEQHRGNECCCQSVLAADRLFFKGSAFHTTSAEGRIDGWMDGRMDRRMEGWINGKIDAWWPAQHTDRSFGKFTHFIQREKHQDLKLQSFNVESLPEIKQLFIEHILWWSTRIKKENAFKFWAAAIKYL